MEGRNEALDDPGELVGSLFRQCWKGTAYSVFAGYR
jgi:hypothetical protein